MKKGHSGYEKGPTDLVNLGDKCQVFHMSNHWAHEGSVSGHEAGKEKSFLLFSSH